MKLSQRLETTRTMKLGGFAAPAEDNAHKYLKIAADIAKDLQAEVMHIQNLKL